MGCNESKEPKIDVDNNSTKKSSNVNNSNGKVQHNNAKSQQSQPETSNNYKYSCNIDDSTNVCNKMY